MIIPSNDAFIANDGPMAYEIFDAGGNFNGNRVIEVFGADAWDAGTEVNNTKGAAFSALPGTASDEIGGVVAKHPGLDNFLGSGFAPAPVSGETLDVAFGDSNLIARITITPEPASGLLLLAGGLWALRRR